jgi:hypothetical protein
VQHRHGRVRRSAAVLAVALVLSGCASNFDSPVLQPYAPSDGVQDREGDVLALNVLVVADSNGNGTLVAGLVNQAAEEDRLTGVQAVAEAGAVEVDADTEELPPDTLVQLADGPSVSLRGDPIVPGAFIDVTLEFARAEPITFAVPVVANTDPYADVRIES